MVIRTLDIEKTKAFFEELGLVFQQEKHGNGPVHFAHQSGDAVLEIYPTRKNESVRFVDEPSPKA